jgi:multidrug efflux pump subunit AcrA (membrane-fusion protein)
VRVTLDNRDNLIKPGTFAHVVIQTERELGALVVPREAVRQSKEGSFVMVVDAADIVHRRPVTLGTQGVAVIAITEGLKPGEKVVTLSTYPLRDGQMVRVGGSKKGAPKAGWGR